MVGWRQFQPHLRGGRTSGANLQVALRAFSFIYYQFRLFDDTAAMVTGVETVGIILAILPLVVNQLDAYVQGLVTIKTFRTKRYRRELESYLTRLGTHRAIFLNTLEQLLEDIVDDDEVRDLIDNPTGTLWQDAVFQETLRKRLGRDHDIYIKTMTMLSGLLQDLSNKLGLETNTIEKVRAANFILPFKVDPFPTICLLRPRPDVAKV